MVRIEVIRKELRLDGRAAIVVAGEIHYFRLAREDWGARLDLLAEAGCDCVASYIPWVVHEQPDGSLDLGGTTRPELDLGAFVDLCHERGLRFVARPGPFVMAELRREGIPPRVYAEHPEIVPPGWDGAPPTTAVVDYLAPAFLAEVDRWFTAVGNIIGPRTAPAGGPVIAVQLDNEIGMLAWVSNSPDLGDALLTDLRGWLGRRYGSALPRRYPAELLADDRAFAAGVRSPSPGVAPALRVDLGRFMRTRLARYVEALRGIADRRGLGGVPHLVNVHGTEHGGAASFPIGISQLADSYRGVPGTLSGSDHYIGTLTLASAADFHMMHAFMDAVHDSDQPVTSVEFEAGTGDYAADLSTLTDPSAVVLKTRILLAQGVRLLSWYLFAGGTNRVDPRPGDDGTHRFGITGQRHGHAAPVDPEGRRSVAFAPVVAATRLVRTHERWLARSREEHDNLVLGLVRDHYLTEYTYPGNDVMSAAADELSWARGGGPGGRLTRVLLYGGYRYGAVDLQTAAPPPGSVLVLGSPTILDAEVQHRLVDHVRDGGGLLLLGALPLVGSEGSPCRVLADALGVGVVGERRSGPGSFPSAVGSGVAADRPEVPVSRLQHLDPGTGEVLLRDAMSGDPCAVEVRLGAGRAAVVATDYVADLTFFRAVLERLGAVRGLVHDSAVPGLMAMTTTTPDQDRFLHLVNVAGHEHRAQLWLDGVPLFEGVRLTVPPREGLLLPIDVSVGSHRLASTAEIDEVDATGVRVRLLQDQEVVLVDGHRVGLPPRTSAPGTAWVRLG